MALRSPYTSPSVRSPDFPFVRRLSNSSPTAGANNWFVWSAAVGTGSGVNWLNAFTTLTAAFAAAAAGDIFWVAHDHAESTAGSITLTSPGTVASPCTIYCVNRMGSVPPVSADLRKTGTVSTTGNTNITTQGVVSECYGLTFTAGNSSGTASLLIGNSADKYWKFTSCKLVLGSTGTSSRINLAQGNQATQLFLEDTTMQFAATTQFALLNGRIIWRNTASAIAGATLPTTLFKFAPAAAGSLFAEGIDLSALGSGVTLVDTQIDGTANFAILKDCKLGASVTVANTPSGPSYPDVDLIRCDSGATNYRHERYRYTGTQTVETTIVRTGGASDGTTPLSWKIVTTANSKWVVPFEALPIAIWNDTTGSVVTVTVEGIWGSANLPQTDDIWFEIEGLGSAASPQGSFGTGSKADNLANGTVWATSSEVWGAGSTTAFKMSATFTPQQKGALYLYVKAAKAGTTFYIDPKPTISGVSVSKSHILAPGVYANELSSGGGISRARAASGF